MSKAWSTAIGNSIKADKDQKEMARLNELGITEADEVVRDNIVERLGLDSRERASLTKMISNWHKGWSSVVASSQKTFNLMRRLQCADDHGFCVCCCTGERHHFKAIDAGHFISATKNATRFLPENVHPQSKLSNNHKLGDDDKIDYTMFMMERYGRDAIQRLRIKSKEKKQWNKNMPELMALNVVWKREIKKHKKRLGIT